MPVKEVPANDPDVDKGYAWVILTGCFVMYLLVVGSLKTFGMLYTDIIEYYHAGSGEAAWIGSVLLLCMLGLGPFANWLSVKYTFRKVSFVGGFLLMCGYVSSSLVHRIEYLYITIGVVGGIGYGLSFSPCATIISFYFVKRRAFANGLAVSASGIGAFGLPFLYKFLVEQFGLLGTFWIIGAIVFNVCAAACCLTQPRMLAKAKKLLMLKEKEKHDAKGNKNALLNGDTIREDDAQTPNEKSSCTWGPNFKCSLFTNPRFLMYVIAFTLCMNGYGNNLILIPAHVRALGFDKNHVAFSVSVMGFSEMIGRIFFGWLADRKVISHRAIFVFSMTFSSIFCFIMPEFDSYIFMSIYAAIIGLFPGSFWSLFAVLLIDVVGMEDFTSAFGLTAMCLAIGSAVSQVVIGRLHDLTGNWNASFYFSGTLLLIAGLMVAICDPLILHYCTKREPESEDDDVLGTVTDFPPLRRRTSPRPSQNDTDSLLEDDHDVSFTSLRISQIYKPEKPASPKKRTSAPLADSSAV